MTATIRPGRDDDGPGFIALVGNAWAEYPGMGLDVDGENLELRALATYFSNADGALWVHEADGHLIGMVGTKPLGGGQWELCKVYVAPAARGAGLAHILAQTAEDYARARGGTAMILWSDTKFDRAHHFYEKRGYIRHGGIRALNDRSNTLEFGYRKPLAGLQVMTLDVAAAGSAGNGLAAIMAAASAEGAGLGLPASLAPQAACKHYRDAATAVALNRRLLLAAWKDGTLAGAIEILYCEGWGKHRAEVARLVVAPPLRRQGIGRRLLAAAEAAATRPLLIATIQAGDAIERLMHASGWAEAGRVPGYWRDATERSRDGVFLYRVR